MPTRRDFLQGSAAAVIATQLPQFAAEPLARNVLFIDIDDIGRETIETAKAQGLIPNWVTFEQSGTVFETFWAAPLCSIFRARALTGCESVRPQNYVGQNYPTTFGNYGPPAGPWITAGMPGWKVKRGKVHGMTGPFWPSALVGNDRFDEYLGSLANLNTVSWLGYYHWIEGDGQTGLTTHCYQFATNRTADLALADIAANVGFINASFNAIHAPIDVPPDNEPPGRMYSTNPNPDPSLDLLQHLDYRLGQVVNAAVAAGYVVIICCDNGTAGAGKGTTTEAGVNTPCIVLGEGVPAQVSTRMIQATDLFATIRRLRGAPVLSTPDSVDFVDAILPAWGAVAAPRAFVTCSTYPGLLTPPTPGTVTRFARDKRYKLIDDCGVVTFIDLQGNPAETPKTPTTTRELAAFKALQAALP